MSKKLNIDDLNINKWKFVRSNEYHTTSRHYTWIRNGICIVVFPDSCDLFVLNEKTYMIGDVGWWSGPTVKFTQFDSTNKLKKYIKDEIKKIRDLS